MNNIKISVTTEFEAESSYDNNFKLLSYIPVTHHDGLQHSEITIACIIDDVEIPKAFDGGSFLLSAKSGVYEIFTCSCGIAGCAGIWDGISVKVRRHTVEWRIPEGSNYAGLSKKFYSFDRKLYEKERNNLYNKLLEYSKDKTIHDQFSHGCDDYNLLSKSIVYYKKAFDKGNRHDNS